MFRKALCVFIALIIIPSISIAEIKTYTHTVKQPFGGSQSPDDARVAAIAKAKREALEQAGTYLESMTIVKNYAVEKDEILALAAGVLKAEIVSQKNYASEDAFGIIVVAKVDVDTSILEERVKKLLQDRVHLEKYQEIKQRENELLTKIKRLEEQNRKLYASLSEVEKHKKQDPKTQLKEQNRRPYALSFEGQEQKKKELKKQFKEVSLALSAVDFNEKAIALWENNRYSDAQKALEYLSQAIRLDPTYSDAYNSRGALYFSLGEYRRAIVDYDRAIHLTPDFSSPYGNRGVSYRYLGEYQKAIADYTQAIRLDPQKAMAYYHRGNAYCELEKYQKAIADYTQAIDLDSNYATAYLQRGTAYARLNKHQIAIDDFSRAIRLDSGLAMAYNNRGFSYDELGNEEQAIEDYSQAARLDPHNETFLSNLRIARKQKPCFIGTAAYVDHLFTLL